MSKQVKLRKARYSQLITQNQIENQIYIFIRSIIGNKYIYDNMPEELDKDIIEQFMFDKGQLVAFKYAGLYFCLPCATAELNVYGKPTMANPVALNGMAMPQVYLENNYVKTGNTFKLKAERNGTLIYQNINKTSTIYLLQPFIDRLCVLWTNLGFNACYTRLKAVIQANSSDSKVLTDMFYQVFGNNKPFTVVSDKNNMLEQINKIDLDVENQAEAMWYDFDRTWNLILTFCGVNNNNNAQKKERMITDEVNANNQLIESFASVGLKYRQKCWDEFNKLFGTNVKVRLNEEAEEKIEEPLEEKEEDE